MMAGAIALINERRVPVFLMVWAAGVLALQWLPSDHPWQAVMTSPMAWEFIAGALVGIVWRSIPIAIGRSAFWIGVLGMLAGAALLNHYNLVDQDPLRRTLIFGAGSMFIVLGLILHERVGQAVSHRLLLKIGDASYSIYLSHLFVVTAAARVWGKVGMNQSLFGHICFIAAAMAACICAGIACFYLIERPLLQFFDMFSKRRPTPVRHLATDRGWSCIGERFEGSAWALRRALAQS